METFRFTGLPLYPLWRAVVETKRSLVVTDKPLVMGKPDSARHVFPNVLCPRTHGVQIVLHVEFNNKRDPGMCYVRPRRCGALSVLKRNVPRSSSVVLTGISGTNGQVEVTGGDHALGEDGGLDD